MVGLPYERYTLTSNLRPARNSGQRSYSLETAHRLSTNALSQITPICVKTTAFQRMAVTDTLPQNCLAAPCRNMSSLSPTSRALPRKTICINTMKEAAFPSTHSEAAPRNEAHCDNVARLAAYSNFETASGGPSPGTAVGPASLPPFLVVACLNANQDEASLITSIPCRSEMVKP